MEAVPTIHACTTIMPGAHLCQRRQYGSAFHISAGWTPHRYRRGRKSHANRYGRGQKTLLTAFGLSWLRTVTTTMRKRSLRASLLNYRAGKWRVASQRGSSRRYREPHARCRFAIGRLPDHTFRASAAGQTHGYEMADRLIEVGLFEALRLGNMSLKTWNITPSTAWQAGRRPSCSRGFSFEEVEVYSDYLLNKGRLTDKSVPFTTSSRPRTVKPTS